MALDAQVWDLGRSSALASHYVYESVACMSVDWTSGLGALGCKSGCIQIWDLERGRKTQVREICSHKKRFETKEWSWGGKEEGKEEGTGFSPTICFTVSASFLAPSFSLLPV